MIRDLNFSRASRQLARRGLLGWVAFTLTDGWRVDGVAVRRTRRGRVVLSFPSRIDRSGREHPYLRPTCARAWRDFERTVLAELGLQEPRQLARAPHGVTRTRALPDEQPDQPARDLDLGGPHAAKGTP